MEDLVIHKRKNIAILTRMIVFVGFLRVLLIKFLDSTIFYERYIVCISTELIFLLVFYKTKIPEKIDTIASTSAEISCEVYLIHYFFLNGIIPRDSLIQNELIADVAVVLLTFICAIAVNRISYAVKNTASFFMRKEV